MCNNVCLSKIGVYVTNTAIIIDHLYATTAKKSLQQLKQLYFEMKEDVFSSGNKYGYGFDTRKMEQVLQRHFDPEMRMSSVTEPK